MRHAPIARQRALPAVCATLTLCAGTLLLHPTRLACAQSAPEESASSGSPSPPSGRAEAPPERPRWSPGTQVSADVGDQLRPSELSSDSDGVYGRFGGDLAITLGAGPAAAKSGWGLSARASALYFYSAGLSASYTRGLEESAPTHRGALGIDLRPLFLLRWSQDWQRGPAWLDLTLDSLSLGISGYWGSATPPLDEGSRGLAASLGLGCPLGSTAPGPWLELVALRQWPLAGAPGASTDHALWLLLSWHVLVESPWLGPS